MPQINIPKRIKVGSHYVTVHFVPQNRFKDPDHIGEYDSRWNRIYITEEADKLAVVAGYGEVGRQLVQGRHSIPMEEGVVGRAAASGRPVLSTDVSRDPEGLYHPLLPETKGELAGRVRYCVFREIGYFVGVEFDPGCKWSQRSFKPLHLLDPRRLVKNPPDSDASHP